MKFILCGLHNKNFKLVLFKFDLEEYNTSNDVQNITRFTINE